MSYILNQFGYIFNQVNWLWGERNKKLELRWSIIIHLEIDFIKGIIKMSDIIWPEKYLPGTTDNYVANEVIIPGLTAAEVWPWLTNTAKWSTYYSNAADIYFYDEKGTELHANSRFRFKTFGFLVESQVVEYVPPSPGKAARIAWRGWIDGDASEQLDVLHAWLLEDLPAGRVRILTQESQIGKPAQELAQTKPSPILIAHQEWLEGLASAAKKVKTPTTW